MRRKAFSIHKFRLAMAKHYHALSITTGMMDIPTRTKHTLSRELIRRWGVWTARAYTRRVPE